MKNCLFLFILSFQLFAAEQTVLDILGGEDFVKETMIPSPDFVKRIKIESLDNEASFEKSELICGNSLVPLYDSQREKEYHLEVTAIYNVHGKNRISGVSELCDIAQRVAPKCHRLNGQVKEECLEKHLRCLKPKVFKITVLSDLYRDQCGNEYRGFGVKTYTIPGEEINTLVSRGHSVLVDKFFSKGVRSYKVGETRPVSAKEFLFLEIVK